VSPGASVWKPHIPKKEIFDQARGELALHSSKIGAPGRNSTRNRVVFDGIDCGFVKLFDRVFFVFIFAFLSGACFAARLKTTCICYIIHAYIMGTDGECPADTGMGTRCGG